MQIADRFRAEEELSPNVRGRFYIDGQWVLPETDARFSLISPVTEEVQTQVPAGSIADMAKALDRARKPNELVLIKGAGHDLERKSDRMTLLKKVEAFLAENMRPAS